MAPAHAHVAVAPTMAEPGATETLSFIVGHGCDGQPTTALRVELPKAVTAVEPQPKAGWTPGVETLADGGRAVTWRGGEPLAKASSFGMRVRLPSQAGRVAFVAVQSCGDKTVRWDEPLPADGPKPKHPTPLVTLAAAAPAPGLRGGADRDGRAPSNGRPAPGGRNPGRRGGQAALHLQLRHHGRHVALRGRLRADVAAAHRSAQGPPSASSGTGSEPDPARGRRRAVGA